MKTKKTIQLISLLLFPITIYYFSPVIVIYGITERVIAGSFVVFILLFFTAMISGRLFCSTICPAGAVQDLIMDIRDKPVKNKRIAWGKWLVFIVWALSIIYLLLEFRPNQINLLYQTRFGISVHEPAGYLVLYGVLGIFMLLAQVFGNRGGCHTICWMSPLMIMGITLSKGVKLPMVRLTKTAHTCISCGKCDKACPMGIEVQAQVKTGCFREEACILCGKCVDVCPKDVLELKVRRPV